MTVADDHERLREDLGGYVLGGLTPAEQQAVEVHLADCADCRAELAELDPVPVLLDLAGSNPAPTAVQDPGLATVGAATASSATASSASAGASIAGVSTATTAATPPAPPVRQHRHRRRARTVVASAGVAVAMVAAFAVGLVIAAPSEPAYGPPIALQAVSGSHASGTATVRADEHGTDVRLVLAHLPSATGTWYECIWWSASGHRWSAGTFRPGQSADTEVELLAAAALHPGWRLAILEHVTGRAAPMTVLQTSA